VFVGKGIWGGGGGITYSEIAMARHISQSILGNLHPSRRHSKDGGRTSQEVDNNYIIRTMSALANRGVSEHSSCGRYPLNSPLTIQ
jgi:hypothetical protein